MALAIRCTKHDIGYVSGDIHLTPRGWHDDWGTPPLCPECRIEWAEANPERAELWVKLWTEDEKQHVLNEWRGSLGV